MQVSNCRNLLWYRKCITLFHTFINRQSKKLSIDSFKQFRIPIPTGDNVLMSLSTVILQLDTSLSTSHSIPLIIGLFTAIRVLKRTPSCRNLLWYKMYIFLHIFVYRSSKRSCTNCTAKLSKLQPVQHLSLCTTQISFNPYKYLIRFKLQ